MSFRLPTHEIVGPSNGQRSRRRLTNNFSPLGERIETLDSKKAPDLVRSCVSAFSPSRGSELKRLSWRKKLHGDLRAQLSFYLPSGSELKRHQAMSEKKPGLEPGFFVPAHSPSPYYAIAAMASVGTMRILVLSAMFLLRSYLGRR